MTGRTPLPQNLGGSQQQTEEPGERHGSGPQDSVKVVRLADDTEVAPPPPRRHSLPHFQGLEPCGRSGASEDSALASSNGKAAAVSSFEPGGAKNRASLGEPTPGLVPMFRPASGAGAQSVSQSIVLAQGVIPLASHSVSHSVSVSVNAGGGVHQHGAGQTVAAHCVSQSVKSQSVSAQSFCLGLSQAATAPNTFAESSSSAADKSGRLFSDVARATATAAQQPGGNPAANVSGGEKGFGSPGGTAPFPLRTDHLCNQHLIPEQFRKLIVPDMEKMMQLGRDNAWERAPDSPNAVSSSSCSSSSSSSTSSSSGLQQGRTDGSWKRRPDTAQGSSAAGLQMGRDNNGAWERRPDGPITSSPAGQPPSRGEAGAKSDCGGLSVGGETKSATVYNLSLIHI